MSALDEFRAFIERGNVIDLAVGIVIGLAFTAVVNAVVAGLILPLVSVPGSVNFSTWAFRVGGGTFTIGTVLTAVINFLLIAAVVFFLVVRPLAQRAERRKARQTAAAATEKECPECLSKIPIRAKRCAFCTSLQA